MCQGQTRPCIILAYFKEIKNTFSFFIISKTQLNQVIRLVEKNNNANTNEVIPRLLNMSNIKHKIKLLINKN